MNDVLDFMQARRSTFADRLGEPGPDQRQIERLIDIAVRVPDHGRLTPWRLIVFTGRSRSAFGEKIAARFHELNPSCSEERLDRERRRFLRAPLVVALISRAAPHPKIPEWEQILSCGAVGFSLLSAATAMGFGAQWVTEWLAYDDAIATELGLGENERQAGFLYIGSRSEAPEERRRPERDAVASAWRPADS